ncbi:MAG: ATP-grasp domain-containing protein [Thermoguttaceae bacterium]|nr:ATP-grasp domain-containing protein [Thermoguttaceae bacterium]
MKKIMVLGASILQVPMLQKAKDLGFYVGVADFNPKAIGIPIADEFYEASTFDPPAIVEAAKQFRPDGVVTLATDIPMRSVAAACEALGLPGISPKTALLATDKAEMIRALTDANVPCPKYVVANDRDEFERVKGSVAYPAIMKPTDQSGSRGVVLVRSLEELDASYDYSQTESRGGAVVIEEFMEGPETSVEVMVLDDGVHILAITDKLTTGAPHFVEMGHSQPCRLGDATCAAIRDVATRAVQALGIKRGPAHVEIIVTAEGPKIVELGARMGGDCITTHLVPLSTGIDMTEATLRVACGEEPDVAPKFQKGAAIRYFDVPVGVLDSISGVDEARAIPGVRQISIVKEIGERIGEICGSGDRLGFVIAQAKTADEAISICEKAIAAIKVVVRPDKTEERPK